MVLFFCFLHVCLLAAGIGAAVAGLWAIAVVVFLAYICVAVALRACVPQQRATLTYREIVDRQAMSGYLPMAKEPPTAAAVEGLSRIPKGKVLFAA